MKEQIKRIYDKIFVDLAFLAIESYHLRFSFIKTFLKEEEVIFHDSTLFSHFSFLIQNHDCLANLLSFYVNDNLDKWAKKDSNNLGFLLSNVLQLENYLIIQEKYQGCFEELLYFPQKDKIQLESFKEKVNEEKENGKKAKTYYLSISKK